MRIPLQVRYSDYDERGHVNNAVYLTYFEIGRMQAWMTLAPGEELSFVVAEARISYRSPAMPGEPLVLEMMPGEIRTKAWVWKYRILHTPDERVVAEGETTQVAYDYQTRSTVPISPALRAALASLGGVTS